MSDHPKYLSRRTFTRTLALGVPGALLLRPKPAVALNPAGIIFRIMGYAAAESAAASVGLLFLGTVAVLAVIRGLTRGSSRGNHTPRGSEIHAAYRGTIAPHAGISDTSYAAYAPTAWEYPRTPQQPIIVRVDVDPTARIIGRILHTRAQEFDLLRNGDIVLPAGGRLVIHESGIMEFADAAFRGYATMQRNGDLAVRTRDDALVLTRCAQHGRFHTIHHDSHDGRAALASVFGEIRHV